MTVFWKYNQSQSQNTALLFIIAFSDETCGEDEKKKT